MDALDIVPIVIYSDGACKNNPGIGGWGSIIMAGTHRRELSGSEEKTTNNRMEMLAAIKALELLKKPSKVTVYTDSKYLCDAFRQNWFKKWKKNGWRTASGSAVLNQDLWNRLLIQNDMHQIDWQWVKGHSSNPENNRCDELAVQARLNLEKTIGSSS